MDIIFSNQIYYQIKTTEPNHSQEKEGKKKTKKQIGRTEFIFIYVLNLEYYSWYLVSLRTCMYLYIWSFITASIINKTSLKIISAIQWKSEIRDKQNCDHGKDMKNRRRIKSEPTRHKTVHGYDHESEYNGFDHQVIRVSV